MAYTIDTYSNSRSWKIEDGTIDQTTDLKLVGKNYAGYGEIQNENFVFLLENFAGQAEPPRKITGQLWFDSGNSKLKFYDGTKWRTTGGAEVSSTIPTGLKEGDFWWDTSNEQLYTYNGGDFVLIGPQSAGSGQTQIVSRTVRDDTGNSRNIITAVVNDETVLTFSNQLFTISSNDIDSAIEGFDTIRPGITLKNTINSTGGVTSGSGAAGYRIWGTASNAEKLGGVASSNYVLAANPSFSGVATFGEDGLSLAGGDLSLKVDDGRTKSIISNENGSQIEFRSKDGFGSILNPVRFFPNAVIPGFVPGTEDNPTATVAATTLGTSTYRWPSIFALEYEGLGQVTTALLKPGATYDPLNTMTNGDALLPNAGVTPNSVPIRDNNGDIFARYFQGVATEAFYADLAEKYTTDEEHPIGTVMTVCVHDEHEASAAKRGDIAIGVISAEPAFLMNKDCEGQAIGLKGRVPVRVVGTVKKGQAVYVDDNGCASTAINGGCMVGIALQSNEQEEEKLVECVLKV
jgi:hypothetical protein